VTSERLMSEDPTVPESHRDLLRTTVATLVTIGKAGYPQLTAVVFLHDETGDLIMLSLNDSQQ
jgi:hypothetical protein